MEFQRLVYYLDKVRHSLNSEDNLKPDLDTEIKLLDDLLSTLVAQGYNFPHLHLLVLQTFAEKFQNIKSTFSYNNANFPWLTLEIPLVRLISGLQVFQRLCTAERVLHLDRRPELKYEQAVLVQNEFKKLKVSFLDMYDGIGDICSALKNFYFHDKKYDERLWVEQDIISLTRIIQHIQVAIRPMQDEIKELKKCVLQRALQVTGEYLKATDKSSHLSKGKQTELAKSGLPLGTLTSVRDLLSHSNGLLIQKRRKLEWHKTTLTGIEEDLRRIENILTQTVQEMKVQLVKKLINDLIELSGLDTSILQEALTKDELEVIETVFQKFDQDNSHLQKYLTRKIRFNLRFKKWKERAEQLLKIQMKHYDFTDQFNNFINPKEKLKAKADKVKYVELGGISGVDRDLRLTGDIHSAPPGVSTVKLTDSDKVRLYQELEETIMSKTYMSRDEFDILAGELWPNRKMDEEFIKSEIKYFTLGRTQVNPDYLLSCLRIFQRIEQLRQTEQAKKRFLHWFTDILPRLDIGDEEKEQECITFVTDLFDEGDEQRKLVQECKDKNWDEIKAYVDEVSNTFDSFSELLAEVHCGAQVPSQQELSDLLDLDIDLVEIIIQNLKEQNDVLQPETVIENKLTEILYIIGLKWPTDQFNDINEQIKTKKNFYLAKKNMQIFLESKLKKHSKPSTPVNTINISESEYLDCISQMQFGFNNLNIPFPPYHSTDAKLVRNAIAILQQRNVQKKQIDRYAEFMKALTTEKTFSKLMEACRQFFSSLAITHEQVEDILQKFNEMELKQIIIYFSQRLQLLHRLLTPSHVLTQHLNEHKFTAVELEKFVRNKRLLSGLAFILTDLTDLLNVLGKSLNIPGLENILSSGKLELFHEVWSRSAIRPPMSLRNFLAHGDQMSEVLIPELQNQVLVTTALVFLQDGKSIMAFLNLIEQPEILQIMKSSNNLSENSLPENLNTPLNIKNIMIFKKTPNWKRYIGVLNTGGVMTPPIEQTYPQEQVLECILGDDIFDALQNHETQKVKETLLQADVLKLRDSKMNWSVPEMAAYFGNDEIVSDILNSYGTPLPEILLFAAESGNQKLVQILIDWKFEIDVQDPKYGWTPLHGATRFGQLETVTLLLKSGANVNSKSVDGMTPLHLASINGNDGVAKILIEFGTDVNAKVDYRNMTPLHYCAENGCAEVAKILLENKADMYLEARSTEMPLHTAARTGHLNVIRCFVESGIDVSVKDGHGSPAIDTAALYRHWDIFDFLLKSGVSRVGEQKQDMNVLLTSAGNLSAVKDLVKAGANVNVYDGFGRTALHLVVGSVRVHAQTLDTAHYLLLQGANVNARDTLGLTPLHNAIMYINTGLEFLNQFGIKLVKLLIMYGADPNAADKEGQTPLHLAAAKCHEVMKFFVDGVKLADFTVKDRKGRIPLHNAVLYGPSFCVQYALARSDMNSCDFEGRSVLHDAIKGKNEFAVKALLNNGADVFIGDPATSILHEVVGISGKTHSLDRSIRLILNAMKGTPKAEEYLNGKNVKGMTPLMIACQLKFGDAGKLLIQYGADVNLRNELNKDRTALHYAAQSAKVDLVEYLIENNASVKIENNTDSILHVAVQNPNTDVLKVIIGKISGKSMKRCINFLSKNGNTPLMWAAAYGHEKVVEILIASGAGVNIQNTKNRKTALHWAAEKVHPNTIQLLLEHGADIEMLTGSGESALDLWLKNSSQKEIEAEEIRRIVNFLTFP